MNRLMIWAGVTVDDVAMWRSRPGVLFARSAHFLGSGAQALDQDPHVAVE